MRNSSGGAIQHNRTSRCAFALGLVVVLTLATGSSRVEAFCDAIHALPEFYVGQADDTKPAFDSACTHNDIQSAIGAATCVYGTKIFITHEQAYENQTLAISDKNVTLIGRAGGVACGPVSIGTCDPVIGCPPPPTGPLLSMSGTSGAAVFTISGTSNVTLRYLDISGGNHGGGNGGGVDFEGTGSLTIDSSWIRGNQANLGAGIYFAGAPGATPNALNLLAYTQILANVAGASGGGIYVGGNALLTVTQPQILIQGNHADNGYGGGIAVFGPGQANIGSPGYNDGDSLTGVVDGNHAAYGGGIAIKASTSDDESALVNLFTTDASLPVAITNNTATHTGGGIYLKPFSDGTLPGAGNAASLFAWDYRIASNSAVEGAAIYADVDPSITESQAGEVWLGNNTNFPGALGAIACTNSTLCNTIDLNYTFDPTSGSVILIQDTGYLIANRFSMRHNTADHVIRLVGDGVHAELFNCLLAENTSRHELVYATGSSTPLTINSCTLANDMIETTYVIHTESDLTLSSSIIDEAGTLALDYSGNPAALVVNYVLSNDITTLPDNGTGVIIGTPTFADVGGGDYRLKATSLGIDFAPTTGATYVNNSADLDGLPRNFDLPTAANIFGTQDLGAYELQNLFRSCGTRDSIFCDGFDY